MKRYRITWIDFHGSWYALLDLEEYQPVGGYYRTWQAAVDAAIAHAQGAPIDIEAA